MRILVVQLHKIGDTVLSTPTLRHLSRRIPGARIHYLASAPSAAALRGNPHLAKVVIWRPGLRHHLRLLGVLRALRYDIVVDLHSTTRTAMLVVATGAPQRMGTPSDSPRDRVYTRLVRRPSPDNPIYEAAEMLSCLASLGAGEVSRQLLQPEVAFRSPEREWAADVWQRLGIVPDQPVVAMSPVSKERYKQWEAARWAAVADAVQDGGYDVLMTHGSGERDQVEAVVRRMRTQPVWEYESATLQHLSAPYERCVLWVGNDGAAKHIAAAAGTTTVAVHCWMTGARFTDTSPGSPHRYVERTPSSGCDRVCSACTHQARPAEVSVDHVLETVRASLDFAAMARPE